MTTPFRDRHPRAFALLFIAGVALGFLGLLSLQILVPYFLGPAGLFLIVAFDLSLYLAFRHRRLHPPPARWSQVKFGPVDRRYRAHRRDALEAEFAASFIFIVFVLILYLVGLALRVEFWWLTQNWPLYVLGGVMTNLAVMLLFPWQLYGLPKTESERMDTTEDH